MKILSIKLMFILLAGLAISGCQKDDDPVNDPPATNEEELITTFTISFIDSAGVHPNVSAIFRDIDGPGGNAPDRFDDITLKANTVYLATIELLNESVSPAENISNEVLEEGDDHLFCYSINGIPVEIIKTDSDGYYPIGLSTKWYTGNTGSGNVNIVLKHQPGIKTGECDLGETDIELNFQVTIN